MPTAALIVAAGRGTRAGGEIAKQWQNLAGKRVIDWTVAAFEKHPQIDQIAIVYSTDDAAQVSGFKASGHLCVTGGETRDASVRKGLEALSDVAPDLVLIHDAARPCISMRVINNVLDALKTNPGAAPALAVSDALWRGKDGAVSDTLDRTGLYRAQTPQGFHFDAIVAAHNAHEGRAADDVAVARAAGLRVAIVEGDEANLKITRRPDFERAEMLLRQKMDIRLGNGFDVHRFGEGDHVTLCGIKVPHDRSLQGHSDADVGMHAVTDAIYGALADGDIGQHFPPSDPQWKGAASEIFLKHAVDLAAERGYRVGNVDCTLICEHPKIGPHAADMTAKMARLMGLETSQISVKATTSERLGFTGRGEGIASLATVTLISK